ncbi:hypothetical protein [Ornithinimicrobium murale]|nr:hypothetical protein [Ornithinimicrobium murale]
MNQLVHRQQSIGRWFAQHLQGDKQGGTAAENIDPGVRVTHAHHEDDI